MKIFQATAFDDCDELWWRTDGEYAPITFFVNCSDMFYWACAESEEVTPENVDLLVQSFGDCKATDRHSYYGGTLFAARSRKMRPQGYAYPLSRELHEGSEVDPKRLAKAKKIWKLFDSAGPPRQSCTPHPLDAPCFKKAEGKR